jgi:hypothetical protein
MLNIRATALGGAFAALAFSLAAAAPAPQAEQCAAAFTPAEISVQQEPVAVEYTVTAPIGTVEDATTDGMSGLEVTDHDATLRSLTLDASQAQAGEWEVILHGDGEATCTGVLTVRD